MLNEFVLCSCKSLVLILGCLLLLLSDLVSKEVLYLVSKEVLEIRTIICHQIP